MDMVEEWVEYIRDLFEGHEDLEPDLPIGRAVNIQQNEREILNSKGSEADLLEQNGHALLSGNGQVAIMSDALACGMRLPLYPFFRAVLRSYNLCPYPLSPNFGTRAIGTRAIVAGSMPGLPYALICISYIVQIKQVHQRDGEPKEGVKD
ncbi:hypothetical protein Fot_39398 [Forsythia ovata]|uniref:Transposase (putative) gypsy type domain-containing protein n=1 Tax=Forsythia ovata TaxID=205694 RepID=A0ABD1S4M4_9LAMI